MNVIMVAEDINKDGSFKQTKGELMCTVSNLAFIKHYYPDFHTILFVDSFTKSYYESFGITELFDEVNDTLLEQHVDIDKTIFWAAGKLMAQRITTGPTLTMDLDFWVHSDISMFGIFDSDISCLWVEEIYCDLAIQYMKSMYGKIPNDLTFDEKTKYILFAEQYLLNQIAKKNNKKVKVLVDDFYNIKHLDYVESIGVNMKNCPNYIYHMGNHKEEYRKKNSFATEGIERFYKKTKSVITDQKFMEVMNNIYNKSEYEGCFC